MTVPEQTVPVLMNMTREGQPGSPQRWFGASQERLMLGGTCWRKMAPTTKSKHYGTSYESWNFAGGMSTEPIRKLMGLECRPTRVDVAFDFEVDSEVWPSLVADAAREHVSALGIDLRLNGSEKTHSIYVGGKNSERVINIYRWDLKHDPHHQSGGPRLRIELRMKRDQLRSWWFDAVEKCHDGIRTAAGIVELMLGFRVMEDSQEAPPLIRPTRAMDAAQMLFQFVTQHHATIAAVEEAGVGIGDLARAYIDCRGNRMTEHRYGKRLDLLTAEDPDELTARVLDLLSPQIDPGTLGRRQTTEARATARRLLSSVQRRPAGQSW